MSLHPSIPTMSSSIGIRLRVDADNLSCAERRLPETSAAAKKVSVRALRLVIILGLLELMSRHELDSSLSALDVELVAVGQVADLVDRKSLKLGDTADVAANKHDLELVIPISRGR